MTRSTTALKSLASYRATINPTRSNGHSKARNDEKVFGEGRVSKVPLRSGTQKHQNRTKVGMGEGKQRQRWAEAEINEAPTEVAPVRRLVARAAPVRRKQRVRAPDQRQFFDGQLAALHTKRDTIAGLSILGGNAAAPRVARATSTGSSNTAATKASNGTLTLTQA